MWNHQHHQDWKMFKCFLLTLFLHKFILLDATPVPTNNLENLPELNEEISLEDKTEAEDEGWLARIVPELPNIQLSDYLKPWTVQIPILSFPEMPSYSISLAKK